MSTNDKSDDAFKGETIHRELSNGFGDNKVPNAEHDVLTQEAIEAEAREHAMGMWACIRAYPWACFWSIMMSMCIVMEAYDNTIIGSSFAVVAFNKKFGVKSASGTYQVPAGWQSALTQGKSFTGFLGLLFAGWCCDRYGYRVTVLLGLFLNVGGIFIIFFANQLYVLLIGELFCGFPWGMFVTLAPSYAADVSPVGLRSFLTAYVQMCFAIGQMVGAAILYCTENRTDEWAYRIPFAVQWAWCVPIIPILFFAPESPWWLVRRGRFEEAGSMLARLSGNAPDSTHTVNTLAMIKRTNEIEAETSTGSSYIDCFKGIDRRRTLIAMVIFGVEPLGGLILGNNATYFFEVAGLSASNAFAMGLGYQGLSFCGVVISWFLLNWFGRRNIYITGAACGAVILLVIGFLDFAATAHVGARWAQAALLIIFNFASACSIYPLTYLIISEVPSTRLRCKTVALARDAYFVSQTAAGIASPYMINPTAGNMKGKAGFVWGAIACFIAVIAYFILPECKDRTYRELDVMFQRRIAAREFKGTEISPEDVE